MKELDYDKSSAIRTAKNPYQGTDAKILCVCSAGLLRSATAARMLATTAGLNTRACGIEHYALVPFTEVLLHWCDYVVCMTGTQKLKIEKFMRDTIGDCPEKAIQFNRPILCLGIPDNYAYMDKELVKLILERFPKELKAYAEGVHIERPHG